MREIRQSARALTLVALAACAGAGANAKPVEPLVIPPMPSTGAPAEPPPPPPPPAPHRPSEEECVTIMRKIIDLTLDQSAITGPQREELIKSFAGNSEMAKQACSSFRVDDDSMRCVQDAPKLDELQKCLATIRTAKGDDDDDDR